MIDSGAMTISISNKNINHSVTLLDSGSYVIMTEDGNVAMKVEVHTLNKSES